MSNESETIDKHIIGGRTYLTIADSTIEQDYHFLALVKQARIDEIVQGPDETPENFARRILEATIASGKVLDLLACLIIPQEAVDRDQPPGDAWTRDIADDTARFLGRLKAPTDKSKIRSLVLSLLISFFDSGIVSLWTTRMSCEEAIPKKTTMKARPGVTDPGLSSSTNSHPATMMQPSGSSDGRFVSPSSHTDDE